VVVSLGDGSDGHEGAQGSGELENALFSIFPEFAIVVFS